MPVGHGGPNAADFVRSNLFKNLLQHPKFPVAAADALGECSTPGSTPGMQLRVQSQAHQCVRGSVCVQSTHTTQLMSSICVRTRAGHEKTGELCSNCAALLRCKALLTPLR